MRSAERVALVTGAARGIGLAIARQLAETGMQVALLDVKPEVVEASARRLRADGLEAISVAADVSDAEAVRSAIEQVMEAWGRIDVLVNNAGICPMTPLDEITVEEWDLVLDVNLKGAFLCSQAVIPAMRDQQSGKIVNIASSAGQMGGISVGVHYSSSKAGILALTKSLARVLAPHIQVNAVSPGTTESAMTRSWSDETLDSIVRQIPAGRLGQPADVAAAVRFLASPEADFITGQTLSVNGGLLMV